MATALCSPSTRLDGLIFISALSLSESWWARYAPQVWMIPVMTAIIGLLIVRHGQQRWLIFALLLTLSVNNLLIYFPYTFVPTGEPRMSGGSWQR